MAPNDQSSSHRDGAFGWMCWRTRPPRASFFRCESTELPAIRWSVKADSGAHALIKETKAFALNVLGKGQQAVAFTFFKPPERKGDTISGEPTRTGSTGSPILTNAPAYVECTLESTVEMGDHSVALRRGIS